MALLICLKDEKGCKSWGEVAPLPNWSRETVQECLLQIKQREKEILGCDWSFSTFVEQICHLQLLPAVAFGLESALLSFLSPVRNVIAPISALFMGSYQEILQAAELRYAEGFTSAKLKVSQLSFEEATNIIEELKNLFRLRVDVNRAWTTQESLNFFSKFSLETFDYIEEPFQNPQDLHLFTHPLAIDESYPYDLTLEQLSSIPSLKSVIYKPTIQGGIAHCQKLHEWTKLNNIQLVISGSFESEVGLMHCAAIANRLELSSSVGLGTYHYLQDSLVSSKLKIFSANLQIDTAIEPCITKIKKITSH